MTTPLDIPQRMRSLPRNAAGSPIPWCASVSDAVNRHLCWICGEKLGRYAAFLLDVRTCITQLPTTPPSHAECALFVAQDNDSDYHNTHDGLLIVWITTAYLPRRDDKGGTNFLITGPENVFWFFAARPARQCIAIEALEREFRALHALSASESPRALAGLVMNYSVIRNRVPIADSE